MSTAATTFPDLRGTSKLVHSFALPGTRRVYHETLEVLAKSLPDSSDTARFEPRHTGWSM